MEKQRKIPQVGAIRRWRRFVRIAYLDEAGTASEEQEPFVVVSGVAIHGDTQWHAIEVELNRTVETHVPRALWSTFYFHATRLFSDHKSFRGLITAQDRFQMLREIATVIAKYDLPVSYGVVDRRSFVKELVGRTGDRIKLAHNFAFGLSVMGLQRWFNRNAADEVAICVADRNDKTQATLKAVFKVMRHFPLNYPLVSLSNFVDVLHFTASKESIGLQLADAAAFFIKRHLMQKADSEEFYRIIEPQICIDPARDRITELMGRVQRALSRKSP